MGKSKKPSSKEPPGCQLDELVDRCTFEELEELYELLQTLSDGTSKEIESIFDTLQHYTPQQAIGFLKQRKNEIALWKAFLDKYGWRVDEGPPNYNAEIIPFPTDRTRR